MGNIIIAEESRERGAVIYEHLQPIVDALLKSGNQLSRQDCWGSTKEGFVCYLQKPIDFALVRSSFIGEFNHQVQQLCDKL